MKRKYPVSSIGGEKIIIGKSCIFRLGNGLRRSFGVNDRKLIYCDSLVLKVYYEKFC